MNNVLVCCECSQVVVKAFRRLGYNAFSLDIQDCYGGLPEWHIKGDAVQFIEYLNSQNTKGEPVSFYTCDNVFHCFKEFDLLIAHPPCTYLSKAGARWLFNENHEINIERYYKGKAAKEFFMLLLNCCIPLKCIENPTPLKIFCLPEFSQVIQPYYFGEPYSKRTLLWLVGLPPLVPTKILDKYISWCPSNTGAKYKNKGYKTQNGVAQSSKLRSQTFEGIAEAMAYQWGPLT